MNIFYTLTDMGSAYRYMFGSSPLFRTNSGSALDGDTMPLVEVNKRRKIWGKNIWSLCILSAR